MGEERFAARSPVGPTTPIDPADAAQSLAWNLEDLVAESRFGRGQRRIARITVLPRTMRTRGDPWGF